MRRGGGGGGGGGGERKVRGKGRYVFRRMPERRNCWQARWSRAVGDGGSRVNKVQEEER